MSFLWLNVQLIMNRPHLASLTDNCNIVPSNVMSFVAWNSAVSSTPPAEGILQLWPYSPVPAAVDVPRPRPQFSPSPPVHSWPVHPQQMESKESVSPAAMTRSVTPPLFSFSPQLPLFLSSHSLLPPLAGFGASNIDLSFIFRAAVSRLYVRVRTAVFVVLARARRYSMLGRGAACDRVWVRRRACPLWTRQGSVFQVNPLRRGVVLRLALRSLSVPSLWAQYHRALAHSSPPLISVLLSFSPWPLVWGTSLLQLFISAPRLLCEGVLLLWDELFWRDGRGHRTQVRRSQSRGCETVW